MKALDPLSYQFIQTVEKPIQNIMLLQTTMNCALHTTTLYNVSFLLGECYINKSQNEQAFLLQCLLSLAARVYLPNIYTSEETDCIYKVSKQLQSTERSNLVFTVTNDKKVQNFESYEAAMQIMNQALPSIMQCQDNEPVLYYLVKDIQQNYKKYSKRKIVSQSHQK
ncbi:Hypothetical_protein [Hexamita inflata]|uniref:Hypothetical_protein n=1 Tax=Hexamita inflata TaxID=28002 RepID=A0ABP1HQW3_9EUKA